MIMVMIVMVVVMVVMVVMMVTLVVVDDWGVTVVVIAAMQGAGWGWSRG